MSTDAPLALLYRPPEVEATVRFGLSAVPAPDDLPGLYAQAFRAARQVDIPAGVPLYVDLLLTPRMQVFGNGTVAAAPYPRLAGSELHFALHSQHRGQWEDDDPEVLDFRVYPRDPKATDEWKAADDEFWRSGVENMLGPAWGGEVLDLGCGVGRLLTLIAGDQQRAVGVDISKSMLRVARSRLPDSVALHRGTGWEIPAEADSLDGVYSTVTLQHITPLAAREGYLREIRRVLRPGGRAGIQWKILGCGLSWWYDRADTAGIDVSFLSPAEGAAILALYGFRVVESWVCAIPGSDLGGGEVGEWWWTSLEVM